MYHVRVPTMFYLVNISVNLESTVMREGTLTENSNSHYVITNRPFGMKTRNILRKVPEYFLRVSAVVVRQ